MSIATILSILSFIEFQENRISPRQNSHDHPCNRSGKSAAFASANPEVASAIDRSSPAFSTLVSRSSRGSSSPLFGSMRQSILGDQCCNRSGEHGGRSIGANPVVIGYCDTLYITCVTITDLKLYLNVITLLFDYRLSFIYRFVAMSD